MIIHKHYIIYQTTNLVNGKIYIGCHATNKLNDNYLGSGVILLDAVKKYGRQNFKREILFEFDNKDSMLQKERELVNDEFIGRNDTYNVGIGGAWDSRLKPNLGIKLKGMKRSEETKNKMIGQIPVKDVDGNSFKVTKDDPRYIGGKLVHTSKGMKRTTEDRKKISDSCIGIVRSEETKNKIREAFSGENNHFYGKQHSNETKKLISESNKGRTKTFTNEHKENLRLAALKREQSKRKM